MLIVGLGGTTRPESSSERALRFALAAAAGHGAETRCFAGEDIVLPLYDPGVEQRTTGAAALVESLRLADGIIIATPGYHGSMSGLVKNALDYVEDLRDDSRSYLAGRPVGCITVAHGWQAAVNTLRAFRDVAHALRGWPTPYGAVLNSADAIFEESGVPTPKTRAALELVGLECARFAQQMEAPERRRDDRGGADNGEAVDLSRGR